MNDITPFEQFIDILGTITFVALIIVSVVGLMRLIMRGVDKELQQRAADKAKKHKTVNHIDRRA